MKTTILISLLVISTVCIFSCRKKIAPNSSTSSTSTTTTTTVAASANVIVHINNEVDGQTIQLGNLNCTNASGNNYSVSLLKYYLSNTALMSTSGNLVATPNYVLIDASNTNKQSFTLLKVPNGNYVALKFYVGVDQSRNHTGVQEGDLDPMYGMIWAWNTGYIFFKHEGQFKNTSNVAQSLQFHYGTDAALASITVPVNFSVSGVDKNVYLNFNLNQLYASPYKIDFNVDNVHQSTAQSDSVWIQKMKANFTTCFSFAKAE